MEDKTYWTGRYLKNETGWDIGHISTPLKTYFDQLKNKEIKILIPGAGHAYEAEYLFNHGFNNVFVLDVSIIPLKVFKERVPSFPEKHLIQGDFFKHEGHYDLIIEQTFFCSFPPLKETRLEYANKMANLLRPKGKLVGLWFNIPLTEDVAKRPFGGDKDSYLSYFEPYFKIKAFELCYNSIVPREGKEYFGILIKS